MAGREGGRREESGQNAVAKGDLEDAAALAAKGGKWGPGGLQRMQPVRKLGITGKVMWQSLEIMHFESKEGAQRERMESVKR